MTVLRLNHTYLSKNMQEVLAIEKAVFEEYGDIYDSESWGEIEFLLPLPKKEIFSVGGVSNNHLFGFSIAYEFKPGLAHIARVAIAPDFIGKGMSRGILEYQLEIMSQNNCKKCSIDLTKNNERANKFYSNLGFRMLEGSKLKNYVQIKHRMKSQYLVQNSSHIAMEITF